ncbi:MAG: hypothetical protein J6W12_02255 [Bacteroidales bacterium]|nr:hypothetical protein [Bacteroidales bacterium]
MRRHLNLIISMLLLVFLSGCCSQSDNRTGTTIVEQINPVSEALLPMIESYTSGVITEGEPIVVRFKNPETLKIKQDEALPAKLFNFTPELKGKAVWLDENTVAFKYDKIDNKKPYICTFKASKMLNVAESETLEFSFGVRRQSFNVTGVFPICESAEEMDYQIYVTFGAPINTDDAAKIIDEAVSKKYHVETKGINDNTYLFTMRAIQRSDSDYDIPVALNGKAIGSDSKANLNLTVYAKDKFAPVLFDVEKASGQATLYFTQPLKQDQNLNGLITFSQNKLAAKYDIQGSKIILYFDKSSLYRSQLEDITMTVSGIRSASDEIMQENAEFKFSLNDYEPKVRWTNDGVILPDIKETTVYFDAVCLNSVTLRIIRIYDDNILSFLQDNDLSSTYNVRKAGRLEKKIRLQLDNPNLTQWKTYPIVLSDYVKVEPGAMYQLSINFGPADYALASDDMKRASMDNAKLEADYWDGEDVYDYKEYYYEGNWGDPNGFTYYNYVEQKTNIVVSDLAVTAKMGRNDLIDVYVYHISDAKPASGAEVLAYNFQRQLIEEGTTDSKGHVQMQCANKPAFIIVSDCRGSKSVIKLNDGNALSYSRFDVDGEPVEKGIIGFAYSNRGVWRPGDEMQLNLMLAADEQLPENYPVVLEVTDASGRLYAKQVNTKPVNGIYCYAVPTNPSDETGMWTARFKVGTTTITKSLRVETVKPNRLEIKFELPEVVSLTNDERVTLSSKWLNGLKANGLKAEVDVTVRQGMTQFSDFRNYCFDNDAKRFETTELNVFSGPLNSEGSANISFEPLKNLSSQQMMNATFTTKVFEQGGDFSIASFKTMLSPYARYVGVELPETTSKYGSYYDTNKDWTFNIAVVNDNGKICNATVALDYALYKLDSYWWWSSEDDYTLQRYASGTYQRPVQNGTLTCTGNTSLKFNIADKDWGCYLLVISDKRGGHTFAKVISFDWGYGHSSSESGAPALLSMKSSAESYNVGDKVVVTFPANDKAKALVTVEANDKVLQTYFLENLGEEGKVEFSATADMIPNVYVYVALIQPHDAGNSMPIRLYGVIPVKVEDKTLQLKPTITAPDNSNTKKTVEVKVGEANKQAMTYTLAVVDEGILGLTNFKTPNPYGYFNSKQALMVRTWDNYSSIIDAFSGEFGSVYAIGGDGVINQEITLDKRFKAYAITLGPFELKAGETNTHEFEVPQCSGALRFMVVAHGNGKAFGSAEKKMTVIDPVTLYASAPRVVSPDDELTLKVQVLAPNLKGKNLEVKFDNKNLNAIGSLPTSVSIDNNGEGMIAIKAKVAEATGKAVLKVSVTGAGYTAVSSTEMPIRLPYSERHSTITKEIEGGQTLSIPFDMAGIEGTQQGRITVSSLLPVDLFSRLDYLMSYPHGCLEQVTSKAFPQLYLNYFVMLDDNDKANLKNNIETAINDLRAYQKADNSLTNWIGGTYSDPWTEIYALHFLVEAQKQGYNVPQYFINGLKNYQANKAKQWRNNPDFPQGETIQAYRLFVLALANAPEMGAMNRFKELEMKYPLSKVLAAAAFAQVGKTTIAQQMMPIVGENERMSDYYTSFGSTTRDLAFLTYAQMLCDSDEQVVKDNINTICGVLNSDRWLDTQTTAFALFTLGKYAEKQGVSSENLSAVIKANGEEYTLNTNMSSGAYSFVPKIGANTVEIKNNGSQKIVVNLFTKSSVAEYATKESGYFINMNVTYLKKDGSSLDLNNLKVGTDIHVKVTVQNPSEYRVTELALSYYLPSGWELVIDRDIDDCSNDIAKHIDYRDDRAYIYFDLMPKSKATFTLKANATYEGKYMIPAVRCEDMYNAAIYYQMPAKACVVK